MSHIVGKVQSEAGDAAVKASRWISGIASFGTSLVACDYYNNSVLFYEMSK